MRYMEESLSGLSLAAGRGDGQMHETENTSPPESAPAAGGPTPGIAAGSRRDWRKLRDVGVATLAWIAVSGVVLWGIAHVIATLLTFLLAAILAYALSPAVKHLERFMPRAAAIALVYVGILTTLSGLIYLIAITAVGQVSMLLGYLQSMLSPSSGQASPLVSAFRAVGLSNAQIQGAANRMLAQVQYLTGDAVMVAASVIDAVVRTVLVGVLSIYLLKDGPLVVQWLRNNTPISHRPRVVFAVEMLDTVVGGYIRGQLTLSALIGLLVGGGMWVFHVPYAVFLGVLAFVLEFVPLVGVFISGAICVILALTVGWLTAIFVLAYFVLVHFIEGDFVGPRIMSRAVGLHPAVSILALFAGAELFGIWGALFAAPVAGLVQAVLRALWLEWRASHPEQFPTGHTVTPTVRVVPVTHPETPQPVGVELHGGTAPSAGAGADGSSIGVTAASPERLAGEMAADEARECAQARDGGVSLRSLPPVRSLVEARSARSAHPAERLQTADPPGVPGFTNARSPRHASLPDNCQVRDAHQEPLRDKPLLPEVEAWTPKPPEHSLYDQFVAAGSEDFQALEDDVSKIETVAGEDIVALEDVASEPRGSGERTDTSASTPTYSPLQRIRKPAVDEAAFGEQAPRGASHP